MSTRAKKLEGVYDTVVVEVMSGLGLVEDELGLWMLAKPGEVHRLVASYPLSGSFPRHPSSLAEGRILEDPYRCGRVHVFLAGRFQVFAYNHATQGAPLRGRTGSASGVDTAKGVTQRAA